MAKNMTGKVPIKRYPKKNHTKTDLLKRVLQISLKQKIRVENFATL
jgi:hypothetical protein